MPSVVLPARPEPDPVSLTASPPAHASNPDLTSSSHSAVGSSPFLLQENSSSFAGGAHSRWQLVFWSYSPRWLFWAAVKATPGSPGRGGAARGHSKQDSGEDAVSIAFCSLVSSTDPLSCPDRNCLLRRIPNERPFCKGKDPSFPFKRDPPLPF